MKRRGGITTSWFILYAWVTESSAFQQNPGIKSFIGPAAVILAMKAPQMSCACTIAGSDPSGGAGVQADLKTFSALGVWGLSVVTAVTSQNTKIVEGIFPVPAYQVRLQLQTLLEDFEIRAFKTGMLPDRETVAAAVWSIPEGALLVADPVMVSSSGRPLMDPEALDELKDHLIPRATLVTPNLPEAEVLADTDRITSVDEMREAGKIILKTGPEYVLVKGGHLTEGEASDLLIGHDGEWLLPGQRLSFDPHGSGCCYSAAITAYLALGEPVPSACKAAKEFIGKAIAASVKAKSGNYIVNPGFGRT
jgi:hydroxymethylpyrimidine/phosphomethylpyrimidine kinase